jgi:hypothetical protein
LSGTGGISAERWRENWRSVSGGDALRVELSRSRPERRAKLAAIHELASGTRVVITASAPGAAGRCRAFASEAGLELEREYLAFPTAGAPAYLVQDAPAPVQLFISNVLVAPPRSRLSLPIEIGLGLLRRLRSWRLVRLLAPGRVVVGRRP